MNIIVCIKPVPDPGKYNLLKIDPQTKRLIREGILTVINPSDKAALEAALRLREQCGGTVAVISMTPPACRDCIKEALAMGADEAYMLSDTAFAAADTFATSYTLMKGIEKTGLRPDLILAGNESADGATAHVPTQLAEQLSYPHITNVSDIALKGGFATVKKRVETGRIVYRVRLPALLSVERNAYRPRLISAINIVRAGKKKLEVFTAPDLGADESRIGLSGSLTRAGDLLPLDMSRASRELTGEAGEIAEQIVAVVKGLGLGV
jgi:electron transfer flavoprotein beta subunit